MPRVDGALLTLVPETPKPKRVRKVRGFDVTEIEHAQLALVMLALWEARKAAKMPVGKAPEAVNKTHCGPQGSSRGFIGRLRELDGEVTLLCAIVRAVVAAQGKRPDTDQYKPSTGVFANGTTICRELRWARNVSAGRAWLVRDVKPEKHRAPGQIDGSQLGTEETAAWLAARPVSLQEADKAVRRLRQERDDADERERLEKVEPLF